MASGKSIPSMSGLVAVKGHAAPAAPSVPSSAPAATPAAQAARPAPKATTAGVYKSMTLKLDKGRYTRLKQLGLDEESSSQDLLTEALDMLFAQRQAIAAE